MPQPKPPTPLFDALAFLIECKSPALLTQPAQADDFKYAKQFLQCYTGSQGTFNAYRREVERLLHWCWLIAKKTLVELRRDDVETFMQFCQSPPKHWIGVKKPPRFIVKDAARQPNPEWRPFVVTLSKVAHKQGKLPQIDDYALSQTAIKESFAILSSFFNYLLQEDYVQQNPVSLVRQKSKFIRKQQGHTTIRRLSELQWAYVIETTEQLAAREPTRHERSLFIMTALYAMYLRISELAASERWQPSMQHFYRDADQNWWFTTVGKGNKQRQIAVSDMMLAALKRWRQHLQLPTLPSPADKTPLLPKTRGRGPITSTTYIRDLVQYCFDAALVRMVNDGLAEEAEALQATTVHWLRHTGISDDVKRRPREHVRDDAGHASSVTTDKYIDVELRERHSTAKHKPLVD